MDCGRKPAPLSPLGLDFIAFDSSVLGWGLEPLVRHVGN